MQYIHIGAFILAAAVVLAVMPFFLPYLKKLKFGQTIYELGPQAHLSKNGTPNMGGILIAAGTILASVIGTILILGRNGELFFSLKNLLWPMLFVTLGAMAIGFSDDFIKDVKKNHEGLKPRQKVAGQVVVGLILSVFCYFAIGHDVLLPFTNKSWDLGIFYIPLMTVLVIFMTNSANLQDGVDGILSTVTTVGMAAFGLIALLMDKAKAGINSDLSVPALFSFALCGGCVGFLFFNHHPAKIFMGDTGSMFIGGTMVGAAMLLKCQFLLIPICFTCVMSSVSVIMQTMYFKYTRKKTGTGKRIFKMTPIHHHFELSGMSENKIVIMYMIVTLALSALAVLSMTGFYA